MLVGAQLQQWQLTKTVSHRQVGLRPSAPSHGGPGGVHLLGGSSLVWFDSVGGLFCLVGTVGWLLAWSIGRLVC